MYQFLQHHFTTLCDGMILFFTMFFYFLFTGVRMNHASSAFSSIVRSSSCPLTLFLISSRLRLSQVCESPRRYEPVVSSAMAIFSRLPAEGNAFSVMRRLMMLRDTPLFSESCTAFRSNIFILSFTLLARMAFLFLSILISSLYLYSITNAPICQCNSFIGIIFFYLHLSQIP